MANIKINYLTGKYKLKCNTCNYYINSSNDPYGTITRIKTSLKNNNAGRHYKHDLVIVEE